MAKKFLLIDDNQIDLHIHNKVLERINDEFKVFSELNAEDALNNLKRMILEKDYTYWPDYILLDLNMPAMDGFEFLRELNKIPESVVSKTNVYVVTSSLNPKDKSKSFEYNQVKEFIEKPLRINFLKEILEKAS